MANVYKPKVPLRKKGIYFFPRTTADQVYTDTETGEMLSSTLHDMRDAIYTDTAYTSGKAKLDPTNTTSGEVLFCRYGRLVQVNLNDLGLKLSAVNTEHWKAHVVATGLPMPALGGTAYEQLHIEAGQASAGRFRVAAGGVLMYYHHDTDLVRGAEADTAAASGTIVYIAAK